MVADTLLSMAVSAEDTTWVLSHTSVETPPSLLCLC